MAKNLLNKYVWLVETIYKAKQISFEASTSARRFFHKVATLRCWSPNGSVTKWQRYPNTCGTNIKDDK